MPALMFAIFLILTSFVLLAGLVTLLRAALLFLFPWLQKDKSHDKVLQQLLDRQGHELACRYRLDEWHTLYQCRVCGAYATIRTRQARHEVIGEAVMRKCVRSRHDSLRLD